MKRRDKSHAVSAFLLKILGFVPRNLKLRGIFADATLSCWTKEENIAMLSAGIDPKSLQEAIA